MELQNIVSRLWNKNSTTFSRKLQTSSMIGTAVLSIFYAFNGIQKTYANDSDLPITGSTSINEEYNKPDEDDDSPKIYDEDIPTKSDSLLYIIDISGSMSWDTCPYTDLDGSHTSGPRIDRAKVELIRSVQALSKNFHFNVFAYDCDLRHWSVVKQKAEPEPKASAISWIGQLQPDGGTGTGPAVAYTLKDKTNFTIVLLSDGAPNCGAPTISDHLHMIQKANTQKAAIHCFGIACHGEFEQFMRDIASTSGGKYYSVP